MSGEIQDADKPRDVVGVSDDAPLDDALDSATVADPSLGVAEGGDAASLDAGETPVADEEVGEEESRQEESSPDEDVEPLELDLETEAEDEDENKKQWYILKVQVNREDSIRQALQRRYLRDGLERYFGDVIVPTEDVAEFTKSGKRRIVKRKLYPGYIMVHMAINDDTWFVVRETPGIGDFTGSGGRPTPMDAVDVERILKVGKPEEEASDTTVRAAIPFAPNDQIRVKEGNFQNFEGTVETIDEAKGHVTVLFSIFGRPTPVELPHWQIEKLD
ncbi:MAG: transcription termination/antitermination protein NusG [Planctomycetota bacterium]|nr:transcription termination/antitermination protein NusG [Planctomycetota bacterium]